MEYTGLAMDFKHKMLLYMLCLVLFQTVSSQLRETSTSRILKRLDELKDDVLVLKEESDLCKEDISTLSEELRILRKDFDEERQLRRADISTVSNRLTESSGHIVRHDKEQVAKPQHGSCDCDAIVSQYKHVMNAFKGEKSENVMLRKKFDEMKKEHAFEIGNVREMFNNVISRVNNTDKTLCSEINTIKKETQENLSAAQKLVNDSYVVCQKEINDTRAYFNDVMLRNTFDEMRKERDFEIGNVREMFNNVVSRLNSTDRTLRSEIDNIKIKTKENLSAAQKLVHDSYAVCQEEINHTHAYFSDGLIRVNESLTNRSLNVWQEMSRISSDIVHLNRSNAIILKNLNIVTDNLIQLHYPNSCDTVKKGGEHIIYPSSHPNGIKVYCDKDSENRGWIVIQRRSHGSVNFTRNWADYKAGFGNLSGDFWLGNEHIYQLTKDKHRELRIDIDGMNGKRYALYSNFSISSESEKYKLHLSGYSGNADDALIMRNNGQSFSTFDADNDNWDLCCACEYGGGWWYPTRDGCWGTNLNRKPEVKSGNYLGPEWWIAVGEGGGGNWEWFVSMSIR